MTLKKPWYDLTICKESDMSEMDLTNEFTLSEKRM